MDGGADADVLQLSTGAHAFADDAKLKNIETIKTASGGSEVVLSAQTEALTITGDAGVDKISPVVGALIRLMVLVAMIPITRQVRVMM